MVKRAVLRSIFLAARPKTLPAAVVPVWLGCVLAWHLRGNWDPFLAALTLLGAVSIQIATNFFNDAIDARKGADTSARLGPRRVTASGLMSHRQVMTLGGGCLLIAIGCGVMLANARGWPVIAIGLPSLFLAFGYTGGPFPLAYRGLGELFVVLFFGLIAVAGTVFIQTGAWLPQAWLLGFQVGMLSAVLISINNLRDAAEDARSGKRTLAVRLGPRYGIAIIWLEIKLAAFAGLGWMTFREAPLAIASVPVLMLGMRIVFGIMTEPPSSRYNRFLALSGAQLVIFAAAFHIIAVWR